MRDRELIPLYYRMVGYIHASLGEREQAEQAYATAIARSAPALRPTLEAERAELRAQPATPAP